MCLGGCVFILYYVYLFSITELSFVNQFHEQFSVEQPSCHFGRSLFSNMNCGQGEKLCFVGYLLIKSSIYY